MIKFVSLSFLLISINSFGQNAKRAEGETFKDALNRVYYSKSLKKRVRKTSALKQKTDISKIDITQAPDYKTKENVDKLFYRLRDFKFLKDPEFQKQSRRMSWMYPDDGCFARAAIMVRKFEKWKLPSPKKLFIFGTLKVSTVFHPKKEVRWWYHVVPLVRVGETAYVLDPAIENRYPLTLKEWALRQVESTDKAKFSLCNSWAYSPNSNCKIAPKKNPKDMAYQHQSRYLKLERSRVKQLGLNVDDVLGDLPPWK